ncbi:MAG: hypothetical protein ACD_79C00166G0006 [uncultured bacterium]|nr:MAG: hypothetical protein ACD_79C00166G0006 [uncultured bacterium]
MLSKTLKNIWIHGPILYSSFNEYKIALKEIYKIADKIIDNNSDFKVPKEFYVKLDSIPKEFYSIKRNIFSTLFQSMYQILNIEKSRRLLYAKLNHLFRIWVTSADNLLDNEDKIVIPIKIPGNAHVMRQVISIMTADRILIKILEDAVNNKIITSKESEVLLLKSLQILLPSAAEEALEEKGIKSRPSCDYILNTIHKLKTGLLFHVPFLGIDNIEKNVNHLLLNCCKQSLMDFGLGCQLIDDIRDLSKDFLESRHNYILSRIHSKNDTSCIRKLEAMKDSIKISDKIYNLFPEHVFYTLDIAKQFLKTSLTELNKVGLDIKESNIDKMINIMFNILDIADLK